jgi:predicted CopG family antitoxin
MMTKKKAPKRKNDTQLPEADWKKYRTNLATYYVGIPLKERMEKLSDGATKAAGSRITKSALIKKVFSTIDDEELVYVVEPGQGRQVGVYVDGESDAKNLKANSLNVYAGPTLIDRIRSISDMATAYYKQRVNDSAVLRAAFETLSDEEVISWFSPPRRRRKLK